MQIYRFFAAAITFFHAVRQTWKHDLIEGKEVGMSSNQILLKTINSRICWEYAENISSNYFS